MPIYEFYCADCNTIFNFFSPLVNTEKRPLCPRCKKGPLDRLISRFSVLKGAKEKYGSVVDGLDESKMEKAMSLLEDEVKDINEDDPKQAAYLMRKLIDATGLKLGSKMEEAFRRMEAGEDPDKIEEEMGDILNDEDLLNSTTKTLPRAKKKPPERDETLYYL
ncbi:MAG: zinc ribbon domain-containing protein [Nitrospirae bacterium]|nr:zinc ribbon domain-containing protein [Nitrospirota bacterium]